MTKDSFINRIIEYNDNVDIVKNFDWKWIDRFVEEHIAGMVRKFGAKSLTYELDQWTNKDCIILFEIIVEIGSILTLNNYKSLVQNKSENLNDLTNTVVHVFDYLINYHLGEKDIYHSESAFFYSTETRNGLRDRVLEDYKTVPKIYRDFSQFCSQMYLTHLLQLSNCNNLRWIQPFNKIEEILSGMHDPFPQETKYTLAPFYFNATRYEVWENGEMIKEGIKSINVVAELKEKKVVVNISNLSEEVLLSTFNFYSLKPGFDRLLLINIPSSTSGDIGIRARNLLSPVAGPEVTLEINQPYACSLYYLKNQLTKVTFSINDPDRLVELYS